MDSGFSKITKGINVSVWEFVIVKNQCSYIVNAKALKNKTAFLSGGSLVGCNILDMLANRRQKVHLIATNSETDSTTLYEFDTVYHTPTTLGEPGEFEQKLLQIIDNENPDLILPYRDDDVVFLADLKERKPDLAEMKVCGNLRTAQAMYNKFRSWEFSQEFDLPFGASLKTGI